MIKMITVLQILVVLTSSIASSVENQEITLRRDLGLWDDIKEGWKDVKEEFEKGECYACKKAVDVFSWGSYPACMAISAAVCEENLACDFMLSSLCNELASAVQNDFHDPTCEKDQSNDACYTSRCQSLGFCMNEPVECKPTMTHTTDCNAKGGVEYLNRHNVGENCASDEVLQAWALTDCGCNANQIRFQYNCIKGGSQYLSHESSCSIPNGGQVNELDRSPVTMTIHNSGNPIYGYQPLLIHSFELTQPNQCGDNSNMAWSVKTSMAGAEKTCLNRYTQCADYSGKDLDLLFQFTLDCSKLGKDWAMAGFGVQESTTSDGNGGPACSANQMRMKYQCCQITKSEQPFVEAGAGVCEQSALMTNEIYTFGSWSDCAHYCRENEDCQAFAFKYDSSVAMPFCWGYNKPCTYTNWPCIKSDFCGYNKHVDFFYAGKDACKNDPSVNQLGSDVAPTGYFNSTKDCEAWCRSDSLCYAFDSRPLEQAGSDYVFCNFYDSKCKMSDEACDSLAVGCTYNEFEDTSIPTSKPTPAVIESPVEWKLGEPGHSCDVTCGLDHMLPNFLVSRSIRNHQIGDILRKISNFGCNYYEAGFRDQTMLEGTCSTPGSCNVNVDDITPFFRQDGMGCWGSDENPSDVYDYSKAWIPSRPTGKGAVGARRICACVPLADKKTDGQKYGVEVPCECKGCGDGNGRDYTGVTCPLPTQECHTKVQAAPKTLPMCYGQQTGEWSFLNVGCNCGIGANALSKTVKQAKHDCVANVTATEALCQANPNAFSMAEVVVQPAVWGGAPCGNYTCSGNATTNVNLHGADSSNFGTIQGALHSATADYLGVSPSTISSQQQTSRRMLGKSHAQPLHILIKIQTSRAEAKHLQNRLKNVDHKAWNDRFQEKLVHAGISGYFELTHISTLSLTDISAEFSENSPSITTSLSVWTIALFLCATLAFAYLYLTSTHGKGNDGKSDSTQAIDIVTTKRQPVVECTTSE